MLDTHNINSMRTQWTFVGYFIFLKRNTPDFVVREIPWNTNILFFLFYNKLRYIDPHSTELGTAHFCSRYFFFFDTRNLFDFEMVVATKTILHWNLSTNWKLYPFSMNDGSVTVPGIGFSMTNSIRFEWKNCVYVLKVHGTSL